MLLSFTDRGIYCEQGNFYIDPWRPVGQAIITHAHADHARPGNAHYLAHHQSEEILRLRLGHSIKLRTVAYGEPLFMNGVEVSLHPAGHILGSAQIRVAHRGEVWVVSGDYKLENDGICTPFAPVNCHHFVTESTFGMPIYHWKPQAEIFTQINQWWYKNREEGKTSVLLAYALGKAQRLLSGLDPSLGEVYAHGAVRNVSDAMQTHWQCPFPLLKPDRKSKRGQYTGALVIAPPSALGSSWLRKFQPYVTGFASGWMNIRGQKRRRAVDQGFVISDHADWNGLQKAIAATEAEHIWVTHGYTDAFSRYLTEKGYDAKPVVTEYEGDENTPDSESNSE